MDLQIRDVALTGSFLWPLFHIGKTSFLETATSLSASKKAKWRRNLGWDNTPAQNTTNMPYDKIARRANALHHKNPRKSQ